jgi:hypothetical protein
MRDGAFRRWSARFLCRFGCASGYCVTTLTVDPLPGPAWAAVRLAGTAAR